jgi:Trypsin-like peptidase domain
MASLIARQWVYATVKVENEWGAQGTGFLVMREDDTGGDVGKVFLVTNKHVVHEDTAMRAVATKLTCYLNSRAADGSDRAVAMEVFLRTPAGEVTYREHPHSDTDVLAVDISFWIGMHRASLNLSWVGYDDFGFSAKLSELEVSVGDEIMVLGYPAIYPEGFRQGDTNLPIVRQGIIATKIGTPLRDEIDDGRGGTRTRILRGFLYDGASIPGSSGSPVILKPVMGRLIGSNIHMYPAPMILLGIVAETRYASGSGNFAGLGLAFDATTIRETIELFYSSPIP